MNIDVFELVPDNDKPRKDCYDCLGCLNCSHLQGITLNSSHEVYIECDLDEEEASNE